VTLANFAGMPLERVSSQTGPTYRSSTTTLAFRVDSRLILPLVPSANLPDPDAVVALLSSMTALELLELLGPSMVASGLRIIAINVLGPDVIVLSAPSPPPTVPPQSPSGQPAAPSVRADGTSFIVESSQTSVEVQGAALITSFVAAFVVPLVMVYWLYRRRKRFEWQQAEKYARTHLALRRYHRPSQRDDAATNVLASGALAHKGAWFDASAMQNMEVDEQGLPDAAYLNACDDPSADADDATLGPAASTVIAQPGRRVPPSAKASVPPLNTRVPRQHLEIRRRRRPLARGVVDPLGRGSLHHKASWFNASEASLRLANQANIDTMPGSSEGSASPGGVANVVADPSHLTSPVASSHDDTDTPPTDEVDRLQMLPSYGTSTRAASVATREVSDCSSDVGTVTIASAYTTQLRPMVSDRPASSSDAVAPLGISFAEQIRRRGHGLVHVSAANAPLESVPSEAQLELMARAQGTAVRWQQHQTEPGGLLEMPAREAAADVAVRPALEAPADSKTATDDAAARSEAVLARARARARARAGASNASATLPSVSVNSQQQWLMAAMDAASEQEYAPVDVQHDWLANAIERIDDDPVEDNPASLDNTHGTPMNSPRGSVASSTQGTPMNSPRGSVTSRSPRLSLPSLPTSLASPRGPLCVPLPSRLTSPRGLMTSPREEPETVTPRELNFTLASADDGDDPESGMGTGNFHI